MRRFFFFFTVLQFVCNFYTLAQCRDSSYLFSYNVSNGFVRAGLYIVTSDGGNLALTSVLTNKQTNGVSKFHSDGSLQWTRHFESALANENFLPVGLMQLKDGDYIIGGIITSPQQANASPYLVLVKLNGSGNIIWQYRYKNNYDADLNMANIAIDLSEGKNGDIINRFHSNDDDYIAVFSGAGTIKWCNRYRKPGVSFFGRNFNAYDEQNSIDLWTLADTGPNCFDKSTTIGLAKLSLDYTSGNLTVTKRFCIAPTNSLFTFLYRGNDMSSHRLSDGSQLIFIRYASNIDNNLLIVRFDRNGNQIASKMLGASTVMKDTSLSFYNDVDAKTGEVIVSVIFGDKNNFTVLPYNFILNLDQNLQLKRSLFVQSQPSESIETTPRFINNNQINYLFSQSFSGIGNSKFTIAKASLDLDSAAFCFLRDSSFGSINDHGIIANSQNFNWDNISQNAYTQSGNAGLTSISIPIQQTLTCKKLSICDSLKIHGNTNDCFVSGKTMTFSAYKNPSCSKKISWKTDTSFASFIKQNSDTSIQLKLKRSGNFKLYATLEGCTLIDSLLISVPAPKQLLKISATDNGKLCPGKTITLNAGPGFKTYQWQDGSASQMLPVTTGGTHKLTATDSCNNIFKDSIYITLLDTATIVPASYQLCLTDTLRLNFSPSVNSINWQPSVNGYLKGKQLNLFPQRNTNYRLSIDFGNACVFNKIIDVNVVVCPETIFFPASFTPDGNGRNDIFRPAVSQSLQSYSIAIYNRFGQRVFRSDDQYKGWDGKLNGVPQETGGYVFECTYQFRNKNIRRTKGSFLLIR